MFTVDLHVHTCLSPCGELEMHPAAIARAAAAMGLDGVAVCDHNAAENVAAVALAGRAEGLSVLPGMEITSREEVHLLALLPDTPTALELQARVFAALPGRNDPDAFGPQVIANERAEVLGFCERLLAGATTWSVEDVVAAIHRVGGLALAAHVDREGFGLIGQLGMIPAGLRLDALEVSPCTPLQIARGTFSPRGEWPLVCGSDAHRPEELGRAVTFMLLEGPTLDEVRLALSRGEGRAVLGGGRPMEDLALHILDIAQNAIEAGAGRVEIEIVEAEESDRLVIEVRDDGRGMDPETVAQATDPFFTTRTTRRVGMGLPMLAAAARASGGDLELESSPGHGTRVRATFGLSHVDRAPLGDLETTLVVLLAGTLGVELHFLHRRGDRWWELDSTDLETALGGAALSSPEGLELIHAAVGRGEAVLTAPHRGRRGGGGEHAGKRAGEGRHG